MTSTRRRSPRSAARRLLRRLPIAQRAVLTARFGDLGRATPLTSWGSRRGTPVDRPFISEFLERHRDAVHGRVLEVKEDHYATRLGAREVEVLDIDATNGAATVIGDLCDPTTLPEAAYDAAIVTQTLQYLDDPAAGVRHLIRSLRAGGSVLITVPCLGRIDGGHDLWRFTPAGLEALLRTALGDTGAEAEVVGLGNGLTSRAFLFGLAAEDLRAEAAQTPDPQLPLLAAARIRVP